MKKLFLISLILFLFISCANDKSIAPIDITELLTISTWLLDTDLEGTGHWGYIDPATRTYPRDPDGDGYWIPNDGVTQIANEDVFVYETLEVGVPRTMAPIGLNMSRTKGDAIRYGNLNLYIDYEGIVEITKVEPKDNSIRMVNTSAGSWVESETIKANGPCTIMIYPVGKTLVTEGTNYLLMNDTIADREYLLQIRACTFDGAPIITAQIKLTAISDPAYPWQTIHDGEYGELFQSGEERTRFCCIELVSYTFNELYYLNGEAG